jgi:uncharacterized membrane protein
MSTADVILVVSAFLASAVEAVEALTVVLAMGVTRGWRSPLIGTATALVALIALIAVLGPALALMPIDALRLIVGALLLIFGLQWLRKAILRAGGFKPLRDEEALYRAQIEGSRARAETIRAGMDWYAFTLAFKGVFLEGLEVAFIVLTFGTAHGRVPLAAAGAAAALLMVGVIGALAHKPLARVPENAMKFAVGLMLATFGIFWSVEGVGIAWPGTDLAILGILAFLTLVSLGLVAALRRMRKAEIVLAPFVVAGKGE